MAYKRSAMDDLVRNLVRGARKHVEQSRASIVSSGMLLQAAMDAIRRSQMLIAQSDKLIADVRIQLIESSRQPISPTAD